MMYSKLGHLFLSFMFLCSCTTTYSYSSINKFGDFDSKKFQGKTICFQGVGVNDNGFNAALIDAFSQYGLKEYKKKGKNVPDFVGRYYYSLDSVQGYNVVPVYGRTGISSVNTNTYGTISPSINWGSYNYSAYSRSTVNYDYGVTGYKTVPYLEHSSNIVLSIKENSESAPVYYQASLFVRDVVHSWDMMGYLLTAMKDFSFNQRQVDMQLDCYYSEYDDKVFCEESVGTLAKLFGFL